MGKCLIISDEQLWPRNTRTGRAQRRNLGPVLHCVVILPFHCVGAEHAIDFFSQLISQIFFLSLATDGPSN